MKRLIKIFGIVLTLLLVAAIALPVALLVLVDPNDYKGEIARVVEEKSGRTLDLEGDLKLTVFPWVGLELGSASLSNPAGFGDTPFARVAGVQVRAKLLPLLRKELEADTLTLDGLDLHLIVDEQGHSNWADLAGGKAKPADSADSAGEVPAGQAEPGEAGAKGLAALAIGGVEVHNARLVWEDRSQGVRYQVSGLDLATGPLAPGEAVDLELESDFESGAPAVTGHTRFSGRLDISSDGQKIRGEGLALDLTARGEGLPNGEVSGRLRAELALDLAAQTLQLELAELNALGVPLSGRVEGSGILSAPAFGGRLESAGFDPRPLLGLAGIEVREGLERASLAARFHTAPDRAELESLSFKLDDAELTADGMLMEFAKPRYQARVRLAGANPRRLLTALGVELPESRDPQVMTALAFEAAIAGSRERLSLQGLKVKLDDTELGGELTVANFAKPALRFQLAADTLDLDRYLPLEPATAGEAASQGAAPAAAAPVPALPLETLRALDLDGTLRIGSLKVRNLTTRDVLLTLRAKDGVIQADPFSAKLYEGSSQGKLRLDARREVPSFQVDEQLSGIQVGPLLKDLNGDDRLRGTGQIRFSLKGAGMEPEAIKKSLGGSGDFSFKDGAFKGINVAQKLREARAALKGEPAPPAQENETDFSELTGSFTVTDGVVGNPDLLAKSPLLRIQGAGSANLPAEQVDYLVKVSVVGTLKGQGGRELEDLSGLTVPLRAKGPFAAPSYQLDLAEVFEARLKDELKQKLAEKLKLGGEGQERQTVQKAVEEKAKEKLEEKLKEKLGDKLKGLFR